MSYGSINRYTHPHLPTSRVPQGRPAHSKPVVVTVTPSTPRADGCYYGVVCPGRPVGPLSGFGYGDVAPSPSPNGGPGGGLTQMPPPCDDEAKFKAMWAKVLGMPVPADDAPDDKKASFVLAMLMWIEKEKLDANDPQAVCDALVKASSGNGKITNGNGNGEGLSTEAKVAIGIGAVVVVGGVAYLALK